MSLGLNRIQQRLFSSLDFKVGLRMLARYPGLTVVDPQLEHERVPGGTTCPGISGHDEHGGQRKC